MTDHYASPKLNDALCADQHTRWKEKTLRSDVAAVRQRSVRGESLLDTPCAKPYKRFSSFVPFPVEPILRPRHGYDDINPAGDPVNEQRTEPRFDDKSIVSITVRRNSATAELAKSTLFCFTRDISVAGLSFTAYAQPAIGAKLNISVVFSEPNRSASGLTGRVVWVNRIPNGRQHVIGVDLHESTPERLNNWEKIVAERVIED